MRRKNSFKGGSKVNMFTYTTFLTISTPIYLQVMFNTICKHCFLIKTDFIALFEKPK